MDSADLQYERDTFDELEYDEDWEEQEDEM